MIDPITDDDLIAFVDGKIDPMRRLEVEAHLAAIRGRGPRDCRDARPRRPAGLFSACRREPGRPDRRLGAPLRPEPALAPGRLAPEAGRRDVVLVGAGWLAHDEIGRFGVPDTLAATPDPTLLSDARQARAVAQLRKSVAGQATAGLRPGAPRPSGHRPAGPCGRLACARHPDLPPGTDRHRDRPDAATFGEASLFATRGIRGGPATLTGSDDGDVVSWNACDTAYALSGPRDDADLRQAASLLGAGAAIRWSRSDQTLPPAGPSTGRRGRCQTSANAGRPTRARG